MQQAVLEHLVKEMMVAAALEITAELEEVAHLHQVQILQALMEHMEEMDQVVVLLVLQLLTPVVAASTCDGVAARPGYAKANVSSPAKGTSHIKRVREGKALG
jgi:hypothetical protein